MRWGERLLLSFLGLLLVVATSSTAASARQEASILLDYRSGEVLAARNADDSVIPASLTKMMTLYLTFRAVTAGQLDLSSRIKVSSRAAGMPPTKLGLRAGDTIPVEDAIMGLVTRSANDAATVLAEALGGSEDRFAMAMTRTARKLGMTRTVFRNASGLPDGEQRTTARDLALLASRLIKDYPGYYRYFSSQGFAYRGRNHPNHNRLLAVYPGMDGLKTGYTRASGFNLAASAVRDGRRLVAVVIGGRSASARDATMVALLDRGFERAPRLPGEEALVAQREPEPAKLRGQGARGRGREPGHQGVGCHGGRAGGAPEARGQARGRTGCVEAVEQGGEEIRQGAGQGQVQNCREAPPHAWRLRGSGRRLPGSTTGAGGDEAGDEGRTGPAARHLRQRRRAPGAQQAPVQGDPGRAVAKRRGSGLQAAEEAEAGLHGDPGGHTEDGERLTAGSARRKPSTIGAVALSCRMAPVGRGAAARRSSPGRGWPNPARRA